MSVHCQHPRVVDLRIKHTAVGLHRCIGKSLRLLAIGKLNVGNVLARATVPCREMTQNKAESTKLEELPWLSIPWLLSLIIWANHQHCTKALPRPRAMGLGLVCASLFFHICKGRRDMQLHPSPFNPALQITRANHCPQYSTP